MDQIRASCLYTRNGTARGSGPDARVRISPKGEPVVKGRLNPPWYSSVEGWSPSPEGSAHPRYEHPSFPRVPRATASAHE